MKRGPSLNQGRLLRYVLQGVALGAVATALVLVFTTGEDTWIHLKEFSPAYLPLLFAMVVTAWACNGGRVWLMCRAMGHPLRYRQAISVSLSTEFGIAATPAGVGGTVIRLTLLRQAGLPYVTSGSLLATDAAVDVVFFSLLAPFAIYLILHDGILRALVREPSEAHAFLGLGLVAAAVAGVILLLRSDRFHRGVARCLAATKFGRRRRLPARHRHLRTAVRRSVRRIGGSLAFLWRERKSALLLNLGLASIQWCCRYMILPVILLSLNTPVNPLPLFLVQGFLFALSLMVVAPGGGGSVELLTALILPGFVNPGLIGVVVVVWRFFTYHLYLLGGGTVFFYTCHRLHRIFPASRTERLEEFSSAEEQPGAP
ncbi:MAG: flippase-like domain-containing protein [Opitutaceae bacterium]|nr:flippase-like domain-containing protein [Opitutaceae bacterium]